MIKIEFSNTQYMMIPAGIIFAVVIYLSFWLCLGIYISYMLNDNNYRRIICCESD